MLANKPLYWGNANSDDGHEGSIYVISDSQNVARRSADDKNEAHHSVLILGFISKQRQGT